jgi:hypothetical protein
LWACGAVLTASAGLLLTERQFVLGFYADRREVSCPDAGMPDPTQSRDLERHAVSNFYISGLVSAGVGSHVSRRISYRRLAADFVIGNLLSMSEVRALFARTPCPFRRR